MRHRGRVTIDFDYNSPEGTELEGRHAVMHTLLKTEVLLNGPAEMLGRGGSISPEEVIEMLGPFRFNLKSVQFRGEDGKFVAAPTEPPGLIPDTEGETS